MYDKTIEKSKGYFITENRVMIIYGEKCRKWG